MRHVYLFFSAKILDIPCSERDKGVFCYVNRVTFGKHLRMKVGC